MKASTAKARRTALAESLRADIVSGTLPPGAALPGLRQLGARFGLSRSTAQSALGPLITEGLLQARPREGVFVKSLPRQSTPDCFAVVFPERPEHEPAKAHADSVRRGFERRISQLGAVTRPIKLGPQPPAEEVPDLAGAFLFVTGMSPLDWLPLRDNPVVRYGYPSEDAEAPRTIDWVHFDDLDGGRQATQHLIQRGYSRVTFMGAHLLEAPGTQEWSRERQAGWQSALTRSFPDARLLSYHPTAAERSVGGGTLPVARHIATRLVVEREYFDAVVGADDVYIHAVTQELTAAGVPESQWPALVGFEGLPETASYVVTSIVPPWEHLGETAADLLWARHAGHMRGPGIERLVGMDLVARLNSRSRATDNPRAEEIIG